MTIQLFALLIAGHGLHAYADITVNGSISHQSFPQDRAATLTVTVTGTQKNAAVNLPKVKDIQIRSRGQSSQINMINGSITSSVSYNYLVHANKPGDHTIPPITVTVGGKTVATKPITFTTTPAGQRRTTAQNRQKSLKDIAFIKITPISEHYPGEIVPITLKVYFDRDFRVDINTLPVLHGEGVVMEQLSSTPAQATETINGRSFQVITWKTNLSGIKTGKHPISFRLDGTLLIPQKRRSSPFSHFGRGSIFDDSIFDDFFGNYRREPVTISSPDLTFTVLPLPTADQPPNFTGAIGDFNMQVSASPIEIEVGEPITLKIAISGKGNFDRVEAPALEEGNSWKTYSPSAKFEKGGSASEGVKTFEQAIVVKKGEVSEIPSLEFSYFDPVKKNYVTRTSVAIPLSVKSPQTQPITQVARTKQMKKEPDTAEEASPMGGLAPIHLEARDFSQNLKPLFMKPWYIACCTVFILLTLICLTLRFRQSQHRKHPEIRLSKSKKAQLRNDLTSVEAAVSAKDSALFLIECRKAIQNQLGNKFLREPSSISLADLRNWLEPNSELIKIFTLAEEAVYAGGTLSTDEMEDSCKRLKGELEVLI